MPRRSALYLDGAAIFLAITAAILTVDGDQLAGLGLLVAAVTVAYPILHVATAGAGLVALLAVRAPLRLTGGYLLLVGFALLGFAWVGWLQQAMVALPPAGSLVSYFFSVGMVCVGAGGATWRIGGEADGRSVRLVAIIHGAMPLVALVGSAILLVMHHHGEPASIGPVDIAAFGVILVAGIRQTLLAHERGRLLGDSGRARGELEVALVERAAADSRYRVLVERVPAAVYIDVARSGGHGRRTARLHEPADRGDPRLSTGGVPARPGALARSDPSGRPRRGAGRLWRALDDASAIAGRLPDDGPGRLRGLGPRRGLLDDGGRRRTPACRRACSSTGRTRSSSRSSSSTTPCTIR